MLKSLAIGLSISALALGNYRTLTAVPAPQPSSSLAATITPTIEETLHPSTTPIQHMALRAWF